MADSDCSNCEIMDCQFRGYSYDCYVNQIKEIRRTLSDADIVLFKKTIHRLLQCFKNTDNDNFHQAQYFLKEIIDMYNGE